MLWILRDLQVESAVIAGLSIEIGYSFVTWTPVLLRTKLSPKGKQTPAGKDFLPLPICTWVIKEKCSSFHSLLTPIPMSSSSASYTSVFTSESVNRETSPNSSYIWFVLAHLLRCSHLNRGTEVNTEVSGGFKGRTKPRYPMNTAVWAT